MSQFYGLQKDHKASFMIQKQHCFSDKPAFPKKILCSAYLEFKWAAAEAAQQGLWKYIS